MKPTSSPKHDRIREFRRDESAPTMVEYSFLIIFIALVALLGATVIGNLISQLFLFVGAYF